MPTEQELISRTSQPATRASLARQMRENGLTLGGTVLVHSSLSSLGWVAGGPVAVIQALLDCVGPQGTIVMPTHSGDLTDPADWRSPPVPADWVQILRNEMPAYDPQTTRHCCKVSDEAAFCLIQRPYISKTLLTRRISPRG
ncbi:AAC(3) family N-acetyltransferase, partial [Escherichia coli]